MPKGNQFRLSYAIGEEQWQSKFFSEGLYIIGRGSDCDIVLQSNEVSRRHTQLELGADGCWIMDLGSANGTQLERNPLPPRSRHILVSGQGFEICTFRFKLDVVPNVETTPDVKPREVGEHTPATVVLGGPLPTPAHGQIQPMIKIRYRRMTSPWIDFPLSEGEFIIGRDASSQVMLDSTMVSRSHGRISYTGGKLTISDLGSKNGIIYKGTKIQPNTQIPLQVGDSFQIDEFIFEVIQLTSQPSMEFGEAGTRVGTLVAGVSGALSAVEPVASGSINLLGQERVTIGRASDNNIVLNHPLISRYHAVIERMGTRARIINLHSANGLFLNGQQVTQSAWLNVGDTIKIGPYEIDFSGNELRRATSEGYGIDVIGLNKWVSKTINLLKDISLTIGQNEFIALVGMSGAGKSTLMDAINGFRPATGGQVMVNGVDMYSNYGMFRDDIGNVPQKDIVHMELTAEQALNYAAKLRMPRDMSSQERAAVVKQTLDDLGLIPQKDVPISRLSGGQLKRVSIGVELLTKPRLFFLDEPTSGLDPGTEYEMMKLLRRLADQGRTIMIITHATKNVMLCDKAIILAKGGNLAFYGPPEKALEYFDGFRTSRERLEKDMEFDDIYRILQDEKRGKPEEWRYRYLQSQYASYGIPQRKAAPVSKLQNQRQRQRISSLKQFFILTSRTLKCMLQDRVSLLLTIALAPLLGLMDFIWGTKLFDPVQGDGVKIMSMWYLSTIIALLVGAMGSVREIVKENDIYKRERAVGLKVFPYALSKVSIGIILAIYQGTVLILLKLLLVRPHITSVFGYPAILVTMILSVISGYLLGLMISALVPNQNSAQIALIAGLVPQFLFAGLLIPLDKIPLGKVISPIISARWAYESFVNASGMGDKLMQDACWSLPQNERNLLTSTQKEGCLCMGPNIFINCADFPGILSESYYDEDARIALSQEEPERPLQPTRLPSPTPRNTPVQYATPTLLPTPTLISTPTALPTPTRLPFNVGPLTQQRADQYNQLSQEEQATQAVGEALYRANQYESATKKQFDDYRLTREAQFSFYQDDIQKQIEEYKQETLGQYDEYQDQVRSQITDHIDQEVDGMTAYSEAVERQYDQYQFDMEDYSETLSDWERNRQEAIGAAETITGMIYDDYGLSFHGTVIERWFYMLLIMFGEFILILIFIKRKDVV